ncbi:MAG: DNA photolyase [Gammaproteobacteria bacterium]|nr:DNA photolyase [Gammaproteobacteria bacterium]
MSAAIAEPTRIAGLRRLNAFAANAGARYAKSRNFDFGPERRGNVSVLSPYVRHRLVLEEELLETALGRHDLAAAGKFVEEVFWRAYFKGWLEHRPRVWQDYRKDVSRLVRDLESDSGLLERYTKAIEGNTGIDCFDAWVEELVSTGYLHNHARMWFASIWVYTLDLPWQLGADFFYRHLVDADPASNTLSWRWVCGLHTQGKTYLARASNIANFTDNRFNPDGQLAASAPPLVDSRVYPLGQLPGEQTLPQGERFGLLITEEDGCPESLLDGQMPVTILGALATRMRSPLPVGARAREFARGALADAVDRTTRSLAVNGELSDSASWPDLLVRWARQHELSAIVTAYAPVGPVAEVLAQAAERLDRLGIRLLQPRRPYDSTSWRYAQRGYFKLKQRIPAILDELAIPGNSLTPEH